MGPIVVPGSRALAAAAPALVEQAREMAPEAVSSAKRWVASKLGVQTVDMTSTAGQVKNAPIVLEGLVRHGVRVEDMYRMLPTLSSAEHRKVMSQLAGIQQSLRARGDAQAGGVVGGKSATESAIIMKATASTVRRAAKALGCSTIADLRIALDAIRSVDNDDLVGCEINYGRNVADIPL